MKCNEQIVNKGSNLSSSRILDYWSISRRKR